MASYLVGVLVVLVGVAVATPVVLDKAPGTNSRYGRGEMQALLPDYVLEKLLSHRSFDDEEHTKLETMLENVLLTFRDGLTKPQPALGLPTLDPFDLTDSKNFPIDNSLASVNATLLSVHSVGLSKFTVDKLDLYLVERVGVLDLTLPDFTFSFVLDVPEGSWVSPLKVQLDDQWNVNFHSSKIGLGLRGKVSVKDGRLSMESTTINLDLGDWDFVIVNEQYGTCSQNEGFCPLLAAMVKTMAPQLIKDWMPVAERFVNAKLDEQLQALEIGDLIPPQ